MPAQSMLQKIKALLSDLETKRWGDWQLFTWNEYPSIKQKKSNGLSHSNSMIHRLLIERFSSWSPKPCYWLELRIIQFRIGNYLHFSSNKLLSSVICSTFNGCINFSDDCHCLSGSIVGFRSHIQIQPSLWTSSSLTSELFLWWEGRHNRKHYAISATKAEICESKLQKGRSQSTPQNISEWWYRWLRSEWSKLQFEFLQCSLI